MTKTFDAFINKSWKEIKQKEKGDNSLYLKAIEDGLPVRIRGTAKNGKEFFKVLKNADALPEGTITSQKAA
jgi:hypothetical protein|tara:strand:+ start:107 stop:319 length:213 start_codon:yes stop_codon:yes gene_type:complete